MECQVVREPHLIYTLFMNRWTQGERIFVGILVSRYLFVDLGLVGWLVFLNFRALRRTRCRAERAS